MAKRASRNAPCPCGSGKKYKRCCLRNEELRNGGLRASQARW
ncbi:MAG: SEC-C metal-binding domain-containing protein [Nitrospirota bacterium]